MFKIIRFFKAALTFVEPDEAAIQQAGVNKERYIRWHKRFVRIAGFCGLLVGLAVYAWALHILIAGQEPLKLKHYYGLLLGPFVGVMTGCMLGGVFACLIAPSDFLRGPLGKKWLAFIGTKNILLSRLVSLIAFLLLFAVTLLLTLAPFLAAAGGGEKAKPHRFAR